MNRIIDAFNKRWNISKASSYQEEFQKFKTRILNKLVKIDELVGDRAVKEFCSVLGIPEKWHQGYQHQWSTSIIEELENEINEKRFYLLLQALLSIPIETKRDDYNDKILFSRHILYQEILEAVNLSSINLSISVAQHEKVTELILHPKGETTLDKVLVDEVLSFLNLESQKHFVDALKFYENGKNTDSIKSAESLRRCLEEYLRYKLKNNIGLKQNIVELQKRFKKTVDPQIRNVIFQTFGYLDQYFNENSKHEDGEINEAENEYLVYQAGLLTRYLSKVL